MIMALSTQRAPRLGGLLASPVRGPKDRSNAHQHSSLIAGSQRVTSSRMRSVKASAASGTAYTKATLKTLKTSELAVSIYPMFSYNASGGGGVGSVEDVGDGKLKIVFDPDALEIPALTWRTASVFGIPIPPPLKIAIKPSRFEGVLEVASGRIDMEFEALFSFTAGPLYSAPPLVVVTTLTTETSSGQIHTSTGTRLKDGATRMVGVARVPKVEDAFLNLFLMLPTDALAIMDAEIALE